MKKLISIVMIVVLAFQISVVGFAAGDTADLKYEFIDSEIKKYISISSPSTYSVSVSSEIPVYDITTGTYDREAVFAIVGGDVVAMMLIAEENGEYVSTYYDGVAPSVNEAYKNGDDIVLALSGDELVLMNDDGDVFNIAGMSGTESLSISDIDANSYTPILVRDTLSIITPRIPNIVVQTSLNVPCVSNVNIGSGGLCWAACVASVTNYLRGTSLSTIDVYNDCVSNFGQIPSGTSTWYQRAFLIYNINTAVNGPMSYSNLYGQLMMNRPPIVNLARNDGTSGHALVLSGMVVFYENTTGEYYGTYSFMDPNYEYGNVYVNIGSDTLFYGSSFTYVPSSWDESGSIIYSTWLSTITNFG